MHEGKEEKKCKGIKKNVIRKKITQEDYKKCLFERQSKLAKMNVIRSRAHIIFTEKINKDALSCEDDKRFILEDGNHTFALKHSKIKCFDKLRNLQFLRNSEKLRKFYFVLVVEFCLCENLK